MSPPKRKPQYNKWNFVKRITTNSNSCGIIRRHTCTLRTRSSSVAPSSSLRRSSFIIPNPSCTRHHSYFNINNQPKYSVQPRNLNMNTEPESESESESESEYESTSTSNLNLNPNLNPNIIPVVIQPKQPNTSTRHIHATILQAMSHATSCDQHKKQKPQMWGRARWPDGHEM